MTALPETKTLLLELANGWLTIWFNTPANRNALSAELTGELTLVLESVREDRSVRGITLRGKGGIFCAGGDLKGFKSGMQGGGADHASVAKASRAGGEMFNLVNTMPQVVVVLVEGAAMAGGLGLVCCADVVAVTKDARFALTETTLGIPPAQIAPYVVQRLGLSVARRLMLTAARFKSEEAGIIGLADHVADDAAGLDAFEAEIRASVMRCAPGANAATKHIVLATQHLGTDEMMDLAADEFATCMLSNEAREGIAAFIEKRKPNWTEDKS